MIHILDLLNKIRWDKNEDPREYSIGFLDKVNDEIVYVRYTDMHFEVGNKFNFHLIKDGELSEIPFHRIKKVLRDGELIWERTH